jgi:2,4-dienoyl-CoA reductase-like NADH-dependent reductase (Old Yellow Enzyme family)
MSNEKNTTSRREFFKQTAAGAAGAAALTGMSVTTLAERAIAAEKTGRGHYDIFQPGQIGKMKLKNRLVRSAAYMNTGSFLPETEGEVTDETIRVHREYAEGEVAMTMTGYMAVMDYGKKPTHVCASHDRYIPGLARMADAIHGVGNDCKLVAEIGHDGTAGSKSLPGLIPTLKSPTGEDWPTRISPSGFNLQGKRDGYALSEADIDRFTTDMGKAARRLKEAGWDGCNIHGTHWYLINTFISPLTNKRTDKYGGSMYKRLEIVRECVAKIRDAAGPDFAIIIKLSCDDGAVDDGIPEEVNIQTFPRIAELVEAAGVDAIDVSGDDPIRPNINSPELQSYYKEYTAAMDIKIPVMLSGGNRNVDLLEEIFKRQDGKIDFFNFARPLIRQPGLIKQWRDGGNPQADCINATLCFYAMYRETGSPKTARCVVLEQQRLQREAVSKAIEENARITGGLGV